MKNLILVHGNWSNWVNETCSKSCGQGTMKQIRKCNNPAPKHGGKNCTGLSEQKKDCEIRKCPGRFSCK